MKYLFFILVIYSFSLSLQAQIFSGRVLDKQNTPIPYASIYLHELSQGVTSDDKGRFHTKLPYGKYTCEVSSLGFVQKTFLLDMNTDKTIDIILDERVYELSEVKITSSGEDPANAVMRNAIARAPYYRDQVKSSITECYLKGTGKINGIPAIMKLSKEIRKESKEILKRLYVIESRNEISFTAPNTYNQKVLAYKNSFPEEFTVGESLGVMTVNLYSPVIFGKISPLSPGAFSHYRFKLEGFYPDGEKLINKIKVIPKRKNPQLISGYIYIIEGLWCVSNAELLINTNTVNANLNVTCKEIKSSVYLPTSFSMACKVDFLGVDAEATYFTAIQYKKLTVASSFDAAQPLKQYSTGEMSLKNTARLTSKERKILAKIEQLAEKENLTTKEAYEMADLLTKSVKMKADTVSHKRFERIDHSRNVETKVDSLAAKKDSIYWALIRSVPLQPAERQSYARKDSIILHRDSIKQGFKDEDSFSHALGIVSMGKTFYSKNKKIWFDLYGLSSYVPKYNFVDGLWVGAKISGGIKFTEKMSLRFTPSVYYTTARKKVVSINELILSYAPLLNGEFTIRGGITSADYNQEDGTSPVINGISSLFFGRNQIKFFEKRFVEATNRIEIVNGLQFLVGLGYEKRNILENQISRSMFKKAAEPNTPTNPAFTFMPQNETMYLSAGLEYTPAHYYKRKGLSKVYENSKFPTFIVNYTRGFRVAHSSASPEYDKVEFSIKQWIGTGLFSRFGYQLNMGAFFNKKNLYFSDFKHFYSSKFQLTEHAFNTNFSLLDNYTLATDTRWVQGNLNYSTPYLLLKYLPFLQSKMFDEGIHLRSIVTYRKKPYSEVGYSIGFSDFGRVGVFVGFDCLKYRSVGFSISIPFLSMKNTEMVF